MAQGKLDDALKTYRDGLAIRERNAMEISGLVGRGLARVGRRHFAQPCELLLASKDGRKARTCSKRSVRTEFRKATLKAPMGVLI
jgi:hypothetical protein